jgi:perosamine synthetase
MAALDQVEDIGTMYCQGLGCGPVQMSAAMLRGGAGIPPGPQFHACGAIPTYRARTAIALALRWWRVGADDQALVPAYNCGTDIDPVIKTGANVRTYRIGSDLRLDLADIQRLCTARTRLIYVIHYFGWPQELAELRQFCDSAGIMLLEDCALAMFSRGSEGYVGHLGDAAVFSLPKTLAVPDGGILLLKRDLHERPDRAPSAARVLRKLLPLGKRFVLRSTESMGCYRLFNRRGERNADATDGNVPQRRLRPDIPATYYYDSATTDWRMSRITRGLVKSVDPDWIVSRRRHNYQRLFGLIEGLPGLQPVFRGLPTGVCPIGLPILVEDRARWARLLSARHIDVYAWWSGYHSGIAWDLFPEACRLKDHVLLLPVHQQLDDGHMDYIGRQVVAIAPVKAAHCPATPEPVPRALDPIHAA